MLAEAPQLTASSHRAARGIESPGAVASRSEGGGRGENACNQEERGERSSTPRVREPSANPLPAHFLRPIGLPGAPPYPAAASARLYATGVSSLGCRP